MSQTAFPHEEKAPVTANLFLEVGQGQLEILFYSSPLQVVFITTAKP